MEEKFEAVKNHIHRNRAKYAAVATLAVCTYVGIRRANEWNKFLDEHGLTDKFYKFDEE